MELSQIIKLTLSIFTAGMSIFLVISFTFFKIRKHATIKINSDVGSRRGVNTFIETNMSVKNNIHNDINKTEQRPSDNIVIVRHPVQNRFKILNEDFLSGNSGNNLTKLMFK
jgi:hypothetical protein